MKPITAFHIIPVGERATGDPGKEIPQFDWREEFPQALHHHEGGENTLLASTEFHPSQTKDPRIFTAALSDDIKLLSLFTVIDLTGPPL